jgi:hypothetical protein
MADDNAAAPFPAGKCGVKCCRLEGRAPFIDCSASNCTKKVHYMCYQVLIVNKHSDIGATLPSSKGACTKKCHQKAAKELAGSGDETSGSRKGNWDSDGKNGPDDPNTSMKLLIEWWMTEGNYSKFCGKHNNGIKKIQFCETLAQKIRESTNSTTRDAKNVLNKIQHLERTFKLAHIFAESETGAGLEAADPLGFEEAVKKKCPYYYDLLPIMIDRASTQPKATSYNLDMDDSLDNEEEQDGNKKEEESDSNISHDCEEKEEEIDRNNPHFPVMSIQTGPGSSSAQKRRNSVYSEISEEGAGRRSRNGATSPVPSVSSSVAKKKSKRVSSNKGQGVSLLDDKTVAFLSSSASLSKEKMEEAVRHNKAIEAIEQRKLKSMEWKGKNDELDYKMNLVARYTELRESFKWNDEQILSFYPEMKPLLQAKNITSAQSDNDEGSDTEEES